MGASGTSKDLRPPNALKSWANKEAMQFKRQNAAILLFLGLLLVLDASANLIGIGGWVTDRHRFSFMVALYIAAFLLSWVGWNRLSKLKQEKPEQDWWHFLRTELIALGFLVFFGFLGAAFWSLPKETRESIVQTMREFIETTHVIRGAHP